MNMEMGMARPHKNTGRKEYKRVFIAENILFLKFTELSISCVSVSAK